MGIMPVIEDNTPLPSLLGHRLGARPGRHRPQPAAGVRAGNAGCSAPEAAESGFRFSLRIVLQNS
jgi:hypothetical protein